MKTIDYLLRNGEAWLQYAVKLNLLNEKKENLSLLKEELLKDEKIRTYLYDINNYHKMLICNHKNPDLPIHKLLFLLDIGLDAAVPEIQSALNQIMSHKDDHGVYQSLTNIPKHFGGSGENTFAWCLCDAPSLLLALQRAEVDYEMHIKKGVQHLVSLSLQQGFPCHASEKHGKFRGPGKKDDCCPYATLIMLKLLSSIPEYHGSHLIKESCEGILSLWENSREQHPYMFYMGTDFRKLKAPPIWYDIISVADCLSTIDAVKKDKRFLEMIDIIKSKQNEEGAYIPESIYMKCKNWDFGQKKISSPYLTFLCYRILKRVEMID